MDSAESALLDERRVVEVIRFDSAVGGDDVGRLFDGVGEFFHGFEGEAVFVGFAVEDLDGGNLVSVVLDELLEGLDHAFGSGQGVVREAVFEDFVGADVVDGDLVLALQLGEEFAELGIVQRGDGLSQDLAV